jgi:DNA-binding response OmpR family regulator
MTLPDAARRPARNWTAPTVRKDEAGAPDRPTILVVDDEPLARQMFEDLLHAQGFDVLTAPDGAAALRHLPDADLILLDAMLPDRDGWSICKEIKEQFDPLLPIIMVTARTAPDDVVRTFAAGADDYVAKPFHMAELTARIESRLRVHRAERALQEANRRFSELADQNYELYEKARRDAEERADLLRELDHRVRNNLSVIMGLVGMERNRQPPRAAAEALASLERRLRSFLLVHEALRSQNYSGVPLRDLVERLAQRLRNSLDIAGGVRLEVEGPPVLLDERQGFAVGLVLNELITNAFRHGFGGGRAGTLRIVIRDEEERIELDVIDDGAGGCCGEAALLGSGYSIVRALVRGELGGTIDLLPVTAGTHVSLRFPREPV